MPDNTNVNNNASVVVVGRTAPVPPGQQKANKSVPVVIASDQSTIPVAEQNKVQSEVALSLLGIPRSEVALGIFADVNTYDVNPTEWAAEPDQFSVVPVGGGTPYGGVTQGMNWGLSHIPEESGALVEAPADRTAILTSKRFFRYQPGRVSAATFGVKTTILNPDTKDGQTAYSAEQEQHIGSTVYNPCVRKYGIFDNFDGYYWETRNNGQGDNFCVVRRTQSLLFNNPVEFSTSGQTEDFGATNPLDVFSPRPCETPDNLDGPGTGNNAAISFLSGQFYPDGHDSTPGGAKNVKLGDLVIYRDNLMMTHAAAFDPSLLQEEQEFSIKEITNPTNNASVLKFDCSNGGANSGLGREITDAVYNEETGLMTVTTDGVHGFPVDRFVHLSGIGMTCRYSYTGFDGTGTLVTSQIKTYPNRTHGYSIIQVPSSNSFVVNVGISTVPTFYHSGGVVLGLSTSQYVSYSKGDNNDPISGLGNATNKTDQQIYRVNSISYDASSKEASVTLKELNTAMGSNYDPGASQTAKDDITTVNSSSMPAGHKLVIPVPFVQPVADGIIPNRSKYGTNSIKHSGLFPYMYKDTDVGDEGYVDTTLGSLDTPTVKTQIETLNKYYQNWINQNVKKDFWNVYEYRVPRSRFSGDRLDNATDDLLFSDVTATNRAGTNVKDPTTGENTTDTSIWDLEFDKVTMYKIEFSWYGAVGALFLAYVPVSNGEARWVRVHHLRASNQLKGSSLGNATLPITYLVYGGGGVNRFGYNDNQRTSTDFQYGSSSEHIVKYGASYYIDGGDRGTVKLFSHGTPTGVEVFGSKRTFDVGNSTNGVLIGADARDPSNPFITGGNSVGFTSSYYVGAKIITRNPSDQNVEVVYANPNTRQLFLNVPLADLSAVGTDIDIIVNRPTPLIGLKCRDFIISSQGKAVRNRTQVYPTRLSTGSSNLIKVDLIKSPIFQTSSTKSGTFTLPTNPDPTDVLNEDGTANQNRKTFLNIGKRGRSFKIHAASAFNYFDNDNSGAYGYFQGKFANDDSGKKITVLGYLERRNGTSDYYFRAENQTTDDIHLDGNSVFLYEGSNDTSKPQLTPTGKAIGFSNNDFTLDSLSSIKVSPELRTPIPKTGTVVASLFVSQGGSEFDLSTYFDFNKEYLSFPLTNIVESLYVVGSSEGENTANPISTTNASITWEEQ